MTLSSTEAKKKETIKEKAAMQSCSAANQIYIHPLVLWQACCRASVHGGTECDKSKHLKTQSPSADTQTVWRWNSMLTHPRVLPSWPPPAGLHGGREWLWWPPTSGWAAASPGPPPPWWLRPQTCPHTAASDWRRRKTFYRDTAAHFILYSKILKMLLVCRILMLVQCLLFPISLFLSVCN